MDSAGGALLLAKWRSAAHACYAISTCSEPKVCFTCNEMKLQTKAPHATNRGPAHGASAAAVRADGDVAPSAASLQGSGHVQSLSAAGFTTVCVLTLRNDACVGCWGALLPFRCCCCCCWNRAKTHSPRERDENCNWVEFVLLPANARGLIISWYWWTRRTFTWVVRNTAQN